MDQIPKKEPTLADRVVTYFYDHKLEVFWLSLYYLTLAVIFTERAYSYTDEREHRGLRQILGGGVATTRGAASGMMFTYSMLLLSMCRNIMAIIRNTFLLKLIPFDSALEFHFIGGITAFVMTAVHVLGHVINFFSIASEPTVILACEFQEITFRSNYLPSFSYWLYVVPTGITGYILTLFVILMAIVSHKYLRMHFFGVFNIVHQGTAFMIYTFMLIHGWGQLVQEPIFHTYLIGPLFLYLMDKLIFLSKAAEPSPVEKVQWLPSGVLYIQIHRPENFNYKAGQWFRIASTGISSVEFHPFTITSAPHERFLSAHIRAVGPWTKQLRELYNPNSEKLPPVILDGPFGSANDTWSSYKYVIFIGAGIGVTPFASILKDFVHKKKNPDFQMKKVIFFWICRTQRQFEWFVDIIKEAELTDTSNCLEVHIFVTELNTKFDLRTIMLYICEKQFYKVKNTSLFTGLRAATHFGRPNFVNLFSQIQANIKIDTIPIFSCASGALVNKINEACAEVGKLPGARFLHYGDNFY